jgi:hypothetical protein
MRVGRDENGFAPEHRGPDGRAGTLAPTGRQLDLGFSVAFQFKLAVILPCT